MAGNLSSRVVRVAVSLALLGASAAEVVHHVPPAGAMTPYSAPLRTAISQLPVAAEVRTGYDRSKFQHWIDADGDGCNTRYEVLIAEAVVKPVVLSGCRLSGGRWYSYYDGKYWNDKSRIDIDHVVALAEAWDSGARTWTSTRRRAYANDLGDTRVLVGVTDTVNQAKGDQDPADWLPPLASKRCQYLRHWVAVKIRWWLTVDSREKNRLVQLGAGCTNVTISVNRTAKPS